MCGAYYIRQSARLREHFGIQTADDLKDFVLKGDSVDPLGLLDEADESMLQIFRPTDRVPFIARGRHGHWVGLTATWWLAMDQADNHWAPNQTLATFNSRIDKIVNAGRSIHTRPPRSFRVLLPASGFVEWHQKRPHLFSRTDGRTLLLGGMAKAYPTDEGHHYAVSIVTLPGHAKTRHIHEKSVPLMMSDDLIDPWLDRTRPHSQFEHLQTPHIPHDLTIQPVQTLAALQPDGQAETILSD